MLIALAGSQSWNAQQPPRPSIPDFAAFASDDAARILGVVKLRISL